MSLDPCTCSMCASKVRRKPHLRWRGIARCRGMGPKKARHLSRILRQFHLTVVCTERHFFRIYAFRGPYWRVKIGNVVPLIVDGMLLEVHGSNAWRT